MTMNADQGVLLSTDFDSPQSIHIILMLTDAGSPPLTRYSRIIITVTPGPR